MITLALNFIFCVCAMVEGGSDDREAGTIVAASVENARSVGSYSVAVKWESDTLDETSGEGVVKKSKLDSRIWIDRRSGKAAIVERRTLPAATDRKGSVVYRCEAMQDNRITVRAPGRTVETWKGNNLDSFLIDSKVPILELYGVSSFPPLPKSGKEQALNELLVSFKASVRRLPDGTAICTSLTKHDKFNTNVSIFFHPVSHMPISVASTSGDFWKKSDAIVFKDTNGIYLPVQGTSSSNRSLRINEKGEIRRLFVDENVDIAWEGINEELIDFPDIGKLMVMSSMQLDEFLETVELLKKSETDEHLEKTSGSR